MSIFLRVVKYLLGLSLIAIGINISKMSGLGISPVSSIPRALEVASGGFLTLGVMTIIVYCVLVLLQVIVLRRKFKWFNLLGIAVAFGFGFMVDFFGTDPNAFGHLMNLMGIPGPGDFYLMKFLYLVLSMVIIAVGVYLYISANLVPMPAEGLAGAISQISGKKFGDCKTYVDVSLIAIALIIQLIFLGGLNSFVQDPIVVREGTILSAIFIGQLVKLIKTIAGKISGKTVAKPAEAKEADPAGSSEDVPSDEREDVEVAADEETATLATDGESTEGEDSAENE